METTVCHSRQERFEEFHIEQCPVLHLQYLMGPAALHYAQGFSLP